MSANTKHSQFEGLVESEENIKYNNANLLFENRIRREWLTTKEAAYFLAISENALRIMVHRDQIKVYKFGRRLRFKLADCQNLVSQKGA